jgi:putative FmdB family regulatory protein
MPIYEYKCKSCNRLTSLFVRSTTNETAPACQHCGGKTARALSKFAVGRSASGGRDDFQAPRHAGDYSDPRQIGRWVENKFDEYGMDLPGEAREMIDAARDGELPDAVKDL